MNSTLGSVVPLAMFDYEVETQTAGEDAGCLRPLKSLNNFEAI